MALDDSVRFGQARYYHDKKAFIHSQVRLLEAPITLPKDWRNRRARLTAEGEPYKSVTDAAVAAALSRVHADTEKSLRLSFNSQSIRQLLEQLESSQHDLRKKASQGGIIIRTKSVPELLESDWIESFPQTWQHRQGKDARSSEAPLDSSRVQKYADLRSRIVTLQAKYQTLKEKHEYYKNLQNEIQQLDAGEIQKNMLTPDSQVVKELEKMKVLLPKLIKILDTRRDALSGKRKRKSVFDDPVFDEVNL
ncbi:kinetochore Sim4 complex subunit Fta4 [Linnemannia elongata]|nr:kinetochore Sim4 complex subunit Fta4 [Linnemannia elongata]